MKAVLADRFGGPDVLRLGEAPAPQPGKGQILVRMQAAAVTTGDWRIRAAAFPGILAVPGRLLFGLTKPRHRVPGTAFAGTVEATGEGVTRFAAGDRVAGMVTAGAHAELVAMPETGAVARIPDAMTFEEAAALPFGGGSALAFLRDIAAVKPGERVLVVGASGAVGSFAVQVARALGARVTGVASGRNAALVRGLGAEAVVDYTAEDPFAGEDRYDVVLDTVRTADLSEARRALAPGGRYVPLNFTGKDLLAALRARLTGGPRMILGVTADTGAHIEDLGRLWSEGKLRALVDRVLPLEAIAEAHRRVESRHGRGTVIVTAPGRAADLAPAAAV